MSAAGAGSNVPAAKAHRARQSGPDAQRKKSRDKAKRGVDQPKQKNLRVLLFTVPDLPNLIRRSRMLIASKQTAASREMRTGNIARSMLQL